MLLQSTITTAANTAETSPQVTTLAGMKGVIYRAAVVFPPGPSGLVGVRIFDAATQLYPFTPGQWLRGDNVGVDFVDAYRKDNPPFVFRIHTYNLDDTYAHECTVRLWIATTEEEISAFIPLLAAKKIEDAVNLALGNIKSEQQSAIAKALAVVWRKKV